MTGVVSYGAAKSTCDINTWDSFINDPNRWRLTVNGVSFPPGTDFTMISPFGEIGSAVVLKQNGEPAFDRPYYGESPFGQCVPWGRGEDGNIYVGMIKQARPHADAPGDEAYGKPNEPVFFLNTPMGFREQVGKRFTDAAAAMRVEAMQEAGVGGNAIISEYAYPFGHNPSPSFTTTWGAVVELEVNLKLLGKPSPDPEEAIAGVYFIKLSELMKMIRNGQGHGGYTGLSTSLSALMLFIAHHPDFLVAAFAEAGAGNTVTA